MPRSLPQARDNYEMHSHDNESGAIDSTFCGYTAYNPRLQASRSVTPFQREQAANPYGVDPIHNSAEPGQASFQYRR